MLVVPVDPEDSQRRMELSDRRSDILADYRLDILVDRIPYEKYRVRFQQIDISDESSETLLSYNGSQVYVGNCHDMEIPTLAGTLRKSVFQLPYGGTVGIVPSPGGHEKTRRTEDQPYGNLVPGMKIVPLESEQVRYAQKDVDRQNSQDEVHQHSQPERSDPQDEGDEAVLVIPFGNPRDDKRRGDQKESGGIQVAQNRTAFESGNAIGIDLPIQYEIKNDGYRIKNNELVDGSAPKRRKEKGDLIF
jgi:hypothetical protein